MIRTLEVQHFVTLRRFIDPDYADYMNRKFVKHCKNKNLKGDDQTKESQCEYNFIPFVDLMVEKTAHINQVVGERVLPTYCYARNYLYGGDLKPHTDRPSCEISITLHLGGDAKWPFFIETSNKYVMECDLRPGDAVLYLGMRGSHWRKPYRGEQYGQVFMHYVRTQGKFTEHIFDRKANKQ